MANTSATGGYLSPASTPAPEDDADLDALFQLAVASITGIAGQFVRPRWQPNPPKQPEPSTDWCAIGITVITPDAGPFIQHISSGLGSDKYLRHEDIELLATFYGPRAQKNAALLRDGLAVPQNMEALTVRDIGHVESLSIRTVPEFVNQQWIRRYDMVARFRRKVTRVYAVQNVLLADINLIDDTHIDETIKVPPSP